MQYDVEINDDVFLPKYRHLNDSTADIFIYWGGRDSGKTYDIAMKLVKECLELDYFKCILSRKVQDTIKESQWQTIQTVVNEWGLQDLFEFTVSPLEIRCVNGNKFIAKGADKGGKVKGVDNPTHAWFEELNQMTEDEYAVISTTLRSNKTKTREYWSFNPESDGDFEEFWLYKHVGSDYSDRCEIKTVEVDGEQVSIEIEIVHSDFTDNEYCPKERRAKYLNQAEGDDYLYNVWIKGFWGDRKIESPFMTNYREDLHVKETTFDPNKQIIISIDFNIDPFSANVYNLWNDGIPHVHQVDELEIKGGTIEKMATAIKDRYFDRLNVIMITGDAMGRNRTLGTSDNKSLFQRLRDELQISENQFKIKSNPTHKHSREQCNYFLKNFPDFKIGEHCKGTRRDFRTVQVDAYGEIMKRNRKDTSQRADFLDNFRYFVNTFFGKAIDTHRRTNRW